MKLPIALSNRWLDAVKDFTIRRPEGFQVLGELDMLLVTVARTVAKDGNPSQFLEGDERDTLALIEQSPRSDGPRNRLANLRNVIKGWDRERSELRDLRAQEDWANTWDHLKTLIFRTATTLMIAAVILGTAYLAKSWEIPLPMLRSL